MIKDNDPVVRGKIITHKVPPRVITRLPINKQQRLPCSYLFIRKTNTV
jgi:hypothetical protein